MTTDSNPKPMEQRASGLRGKLLRSHLTLALIGILALLVSLFVIFNLGNITQKLTQHRAPAVEASMRASAGLDRSLAALRGWILLGNPEFAEQRKEAWQQEIEPAMFKLTRLVKTNPQDSKITVAELENLRTMLADLRENQWWIEDVARTPGNQPASVIIQLELRPLSDRIFDAITAMIEMEKDPDALDARKQVLALFADVRGYFTQTNNHLERFVDTAEEADSDHFRRMLGIVDRRLKQIEDQFEMLTDDQREQFDLIRRQLPAFKASSEQAIEVRMSDEWNLALAWLRTEALPQVNQAAATLTKLSQAEVAQMNADSELVRRNGRTATFVSAALVGLMALVAGFLSIRSATRITKPIEQLATATRHLADGSLTDDIPVSGNDEIAHLTASFNSMRSSLEQGRASLEDRERRMRTILESTPNGIVVVDHAGVIKLVNSETEQLFGYSRDELIDQPIELLVPDSIRDRHPQLRNKFFANPEVRRMGTGRNLTARKKDGTEFSVEVGLNPLTTEEGLFVLAAVVDVTAMMAAEEAQTKALAAAEAANRAKSDFLANMSHEIRTPLNAVIGMTELLLDGSLQSEQREYMKMVQDSGESLLSIVNDILDFSKIEAGKLLIDKHPFDIREALGNAMKSLGERAHRKELELAFHVGMDVPRNILGDVGRIRQVIINLVGNAIKFTHEGEVCLDINVVDANQDSVRLMFEVRDTGIGISSEKLEHIFGAFEQADSSTTREFGGTGLGLSISERLVKLMGGKLTVDSDEGKGSQFRFTLHFDIADVTTAVNKPAQVPVVEKLHGTRVLIVDDNRTNRHILDEMVRSWGMRPTLAEDVDHALQELRKSGEQKYPLILSDVHMPQKDGFTLVRQVHDTAEWKDTVFIMLSSGDRPGDIDLCRQFGLPSYLIKPVKQSELYKAVTQALGVIWAEDEFETLTSDIDMRSLNILLAEDSLPNQKLAVGVLNKLGHRVTVAENGQEAFEQVESGKQFDLILMDVQMPVMDGFEATAAIRTHQAERGHACPIVAMTAHAMQGDRERCLDAGMDDYVAKPVRIKDLREAMVRVVPDLEAPTSSSPDDVRTPMTSTDDSSFDWSAGLETCDGDQELLKEIVLAFEEERPRVVADLENAVRNSEADQISKVAHKLKGALHTIGAVEAAQQAEQLEIAAHRKDINMVARILPELVDALGRLQKQIESSFH